MIGFNKSNSLTSPEMSKAAQLGDANASMMQKVNQCKIWIQDNPLMALGGAIGCGMILGWVLKPKK